MNRMSRQWVSGVAVMAALASGHAAFAMAGEYGKGDPKHPLSSPDWANGVAILANRTDRIGGHWVNASSWFHYRGDAKAFNNFLNQYVQVEQPDLTLYLGDAKGLFGAQIPNVSPGYDWEMTVTGWGSSNVGVTLSLGNQIRLKDIKVPAALRVEFIGTKTPEIEAFLAKHKAQYNKIHSKENSKTKGTADVHLP